MDIQYTYDCKLKKIHEMLLTTLKHNQHDVICSDKWLIKLLIANHSCKLLNAGRICHLENVKSYMSYLQQCTKIICEKEIDIY
jgi:hypothetical protein